MFLHFSRSTRLTYLCTASNSKIQLENNLENLYEYWKKKIWIKRDWGVRKYKNLLNNPNLNEFFTILSSMFLHGGFLHIIGNMLFLWIYGNNIEDSMGHVKFFFFYILIW